ncbi:MAG: hypothetical protein AVDCRST_MAG07-1816 [uncultured Frankineae bacterium]|uniref:HTH araC/xylS-type domain-containing protein n=1 Tax=uncultured Frankineae bacterium TaxID=437475 RepID=A0A6J4LKW7_9ACTN|nr:MAG: hypothetical protein AVDCRST_MAG07-1816 [uncultured Frankineae bacterium]
MLSPVVLSPVVLPPPELLVPSTVSPPGTAVYPAGSRIGPRLLDDFELVLVVAGSAELTLDDHTELLLPGSWVLARPGTRDSYAWDRGRLSRHLYVHFDLSPRPEVADWPQVRHWPAETGLAAQLRRLVWLGGDGGGADRTTALRLGLAALLAGVVGGLVPGTASPRAANAALVGALAHVRGRWDADGLVPVGREELAAAAAVSVAHLSRLWRTEFGLGPARALELVRLARALVLLRGGSMGVREIGEAIGFRDPYHFSHRFRASFGTSPSAYRAASPDEQRAVVVPGGVTRLERLLAQEAPYG